MSGRSFVSWIMHLSMSSSRSLILISGTLVLRPSALYCIIFRDDCFLLGMASEICVSSPGVIGVWSTLVSHGRQLQLPVSWLTEATLRDRVEQDLWNGVLHLVQMRGVKSFLIVFLHFPQCRFAGGAVGVGGRGVGVSALVFACPSVCWAHRHAVFGAYFPIPLHLGTRWQTLSHDGAVQARGFVPLRMAFLHAVQISDAVAAGRCCWMAC